LNGRVRNLCGCMHDLGSFGSDTPGGHAVELQAAAIASVMCASPAWQASSAWHAVLGSLHSMRQAGPQQWPTAWHRYGLLLQTLCSASAGALARSRCCTASALPQAVGGPPLLLRAGKVALGQRPSLLDSLVAGLHISSKLGVEPTRQDGFTAKHDMQPDAGWTAATGNKD
jgi:hypothetical protein